MRLHPENSITANDVIREIAGNLARAHTTPSAAFGGRGHRLAQLYSNLRCGRACVKDPYDANLRELLRRSRRA